MVILIFPQSLKRRWKTHFNGKYAEAKHRVRVELFVKSIILFYTYN